MKYCPDSEVLLIWGGRHLSQEPISPCRKGRDWSTDSGSTGEGVKNLPAEVWKRRMGWAASEPHPKELGIWQMAEQQCRKKREHCKGMDSHSGSLVNVGAAKL